MKGEKQDRNDNHAVRHQGAVQSSPAHKRYWSLLYPCRKYTFFKPKFIIYATYLSEKIGYWRYISIYRHLQRNPDNQLYPLFEYFENWCQDENRHGDFFSAILKVSLAGWE